MIHDLLLTLDETPAPLPTRSSWRWRQSWSSSWPCGSLAAPGARSSSRSPSCLLALGLAVGLVGLDKPASSGTLGRRGRPGRGPHRPAQPSAGGSRSPPPASSWPPGSCTSSTTWPSSEKPGERARRQLEQDAGPGAGPGQRPPLCGPRPSAAGASPTPGAGRLQGQFWGAKGQRLGNRFCLSGEDIARGVAVFGPQGSGKTQCVILPAIADRMRDGHSLIVTDVQGELQPYIERIASRHRPRCWSCTTPASRRAAAPSTSATGSTTWPTPTPWPPCCSPRPTAGATPSGPGRPSTCWPPAPCTTPAFGAGARRPPATCTQMAKELAASQAPGAADLAADFTGSMRTQEPKLALNIMADAFNVGLAPWADPAVRAITAHTDLDLAAQLARVPTVLILRCARRHTEAYGPYLGTVLRVLTTRLDDIGERQPDGAAAHPGGPHPGGVPGPGPPRFPGARHQPGAQAAHLGPDRRPVAGPVRPRLPGAGRGRPAAGRAGDQDRLWRLRPADRRVLQRRRAASRPWPWPRCPARGAGRPGSTTAPRPACAAAPCCCPTT